jgi:mono/diheme cytochrome c family protein
MNMRAVTLGAAVTLLCAGAGEPAQQPQDPPTGAEGGKIVYRTICASCHGEEARGDGPVAAGLKTKPANLREIVRRAGGSFPEEKVKRHIDGRDEVTVHGTREMPVWGDSLATAVPYVKEREERIERAIAMLIDYLKAIQE